MPSADVRMATNAATTISPELLAVSKPYSSKDVEGLVMEIKENLRLSSAAATSSTSAASQMMLKALPCSRQLSRRSSRASPYKVPVRYATGANSCCDNCTTRMRQRTKVVEDAQEDPYELLQKLLKDGSLVNEAVRRLQLGLSPKQRYFYESEEDTSPVLRF